MVHPCRPTSRSRGGPSARPSYPLSLPPAQHFHSKPGPENENRKPPARAPEMCYIAIMDPKAAPPTTVHPPFIVRRPWACRRHTAQVPITRITPCTTKRTLFQQIGPFCRILWQLIALFRPKVGNPLVLSQNTTRLSCHERRKLFRLFTTHKGFTRLPMPSRYPFDTLPAGAVEMGPVPAILDDVWLQLELPPSPRCPGRWENAH